MLRVVRAQVGVIVDREQRLPGRGAYVHRDAACMAKAVKRGGLARTLRTPVPAAILAVLEQIQTDEKGAQ